MKPNLRLSLAIAGCLTAFAHLSPLAAQIDVGDAATLQADINAGDTSFTLTNNINLNNPIFIGTLTSPTITINGGGFTLSSNSSEIFFVQSGNVTLNDMTLSGNAVGGNGAAGQSSGGGALGAGGAIFIGSTGTVTASGVQFANNSATGGSSVAGTVGEGGGGGMNGGNGGVGSPLGGGGGGGNGGNGGNGAEGGGAGGGGGLLATGGTATTSMGNGIGGNGGSLTGTGGAGGTGVANGGAGGTNGGGGGGGAGNSSGTNGGNGGTNGGGGGAGRLGTTAGNGGMYGGGGGIGLGMMARGGNGGFGGGGGAASVIGGTGGFGGGAGGDFYDGASTGTGGMGGGNALHGNAAGGGGAGLGGAVFEQAGGEFIISGSETFTGNQVTGGTGAHNGAAAGSSIFVMTGAGIVIAPGMNNTITVNGTIADDSAASLSAGNGYTPGTASGVGIQYGSTSSVGGTVILNGANTFSGGGTITNATIVEAGNATALGTGPLTNSAGVLTVGNGNHTIDLGGFTQSNLGILTLNATGPSTGATTDLLHVTNTAAGQTSLNGTLVINFSGFTAAAGPARTLAFTVVQTNAGYTGTFATFDSLGLTGATASLAYVGDDVNVLIAIPGSPISTFGLSSNERGILTPINAAISSGQSSPGLTTLSTALGNLPGSSLGSALDQISPAKFHTFASTTAFNNEAFVAQDMDIYLQSLRDDATGGFASGKGKLDSSGFVVNDPNIDPGLQMIHSRMLAWEDPVGTLTDMPGAVLGGIDMKEIKPRSAPAAATDAKPWDVFLRGNVILAQGFSQADVPHFDDNSESVVVGADYHLSQHFLVGVTASYAHTDATLDTFNSSATVDSYSPGIYASYADGGWFANFIGRYSYNTYTEARNIAFLGQTANGGTTGNEGMVDLDGGYDFHSGAWTYGPVAGLQYTHLTVNSYSEADSAADLSIDEDQDDSLRSRLGGSVRYSLNGCGVRFTPHLEATWQHEFMDQSRGLTSSFTQFSGGSFTVRTPNASEDSALVDLGLDAQVNNSITVFGDYVVQAGQDDYFGQSIQAGVRVNF